MVTMVYGSNQIQVFKFVSGPLHALSLWLTVFRYEILNLEC